MRYRCWMLSLAFLAVGVWGCGNPDPAGETPTPEGGETRSGEDPVAGESGPGDSADTSHPAAAVSFFLDSLRKGDDEAVMAMYTRQAREQATQLNQHFAPKGSDTAQFEVGEVERLAEDGARVHTRWTDLNQDGQPHTDEILWMVRREPEGWRIAGMGATVFAGEPPLLLDFEDLKATLRKIELLREEIYRRAQEEQLEARRRENSGDSVRR